jgi:hypothetical protein
MTLIGAMAIDTLFFHATGVSIRRSESGCFGNPRGPVVPRSEVVMKRNTKPKRMK